MAEFLTTKGIQSNIEAIITEAKKKIVLVSPFIKLSDYYLDCLTRAAERGVTIIIIYGKSEMNSTVATRISDIKNIEVHYFEHLHAKCYLNESKMVITSMNLYDASEKNREMGVLVHRNVDADLFQKAVEEVQLILKSPQTVRQEVVTTEEWFEAEVDEEDLMGCCIRCGTDIEYDTDRPFCSNCYSKWAEHENPFYTERYCHSCGEKRSTSKEKPECYDCYFINSMDDFV